MTVDDSNDSLQLFTCLAEDPFGSVHFGVEWRKGRKSREVLVRRYRDVWFDHGLLTRVPEVRRSLVRLGHLKSFQDCHLSADGSLQLIWPFAPGHSLAQALQASAAQVLPFGIDQALTLIWALAHHIRRLHQAGLPLGFLTPHRIWIGFDGWVQLLDVPTIEVLHELLPKVPEAREAVAAYLGGPAKEGIIHDSFQLGALLFEMLASEPLPSRWDVRLPLESLSVRDADGTLGPIPAPLVGLMKRLLGLSTPFASLEDLEATLERSLFDGDFNPTTFGLAFTMQTLFRHEPETLESGNAPAMQAAEVGAVSPPPSVPPKRWKAGIAAAFGGTLVLGASGAWWAMKSDRDRPLVTPSAPPARVLPIRLPALEAALPKPQPPSTVPLSPPSPEPKADAAVPAPPSTAIVPAPKVAAQLVRMRVFVDESGKARQIRVLDGISEDSELGRRAALLALARRYAPVVEEGQPVRGWTEISLMVK